MIDNLQYAFDGAWRVLLAGLVFGAALPALYAVGIRSLAWAEGGDAEVSHARPQPLGKLVAGLCFLIIVLAVVLGITIIAAAGSGNEVSFEHGYPTITSKDG